MKRLALAFTTALCVLGIGSQALAVSITLSPAAQIINVGDNTTVDIVVSGLGNLISPSLGAFDLEFGYDSSVVAANSVTFGSFLDLGIPGIQFSDLTTPGSAFVTEVSFEDPGDLDAAQPDTFILATLGFHGSAVGTTGIDLLFASLSDELANSLTFDLTFDFTGATITVQAAPPSLPDAGSTLALLGIALVGMMALRGKMIRRVSR